MPTKLTTAENGERTSPCVALAMASCAGVITTARSRLQKSGAMSALANTVALSSRSSACSKMSTVLPVLDTEDLSGTPAPSRWQPSPSISNDGQMASRFRHDKTRSPRSETSRTKLSNRRFLPVAFQSALGHLCKALATAGHPGDDGFNQRAPDAEELPSFETALRASSG